MTTPDTPAQKTPPRLFLIDAYALIYRSFFAFINRPLVNSRGENTSAPWGVINFLLRIREKHSPEYLAVVFDAGMSHREKEYPAYKATREKMPDELRASLPRVRALLEAFHDPIVELDGYEADDVIGTLAHAARRKGIEAVIVSGDKDFHQLVGPGIRLLNPGRGGPSGVEEEWVDESNGAERLGVPPESVVDFLALTGDASDNVPGAPGIGEGWARRLLKEVGTLEEILANPSAIPWAAKRDAIAANIDQVRLSKRLVTILTDLPVPLDLERFQVMQPDFDKLRAICVELEFRTLIERFSQGAGAAARAATERKVDYRVVRDISEIPGIVQEIREAGRFALDTETTSIDAVRADLVGISLAWKPDAAVYLPMRHDLPVGSLLDGMDGEAPAPPANLPPLSDPRMAPLVELLVDPKIPKVGQNMKYDLLVFRRAGVDVQGLDFDTMIGSYLLDPGRRQHSLDTLAMDFLGHTMISYEEVTGKGKSQVPFSQVPLERAAEYACEDADITLRIAEHFQAELDAQQLTPLLRELEMPLIPVLAEMEWDGIRIDGPLFADMSVRLERDLRLSRAEIYKEAGMEFNVNSTPQLREVLFEKLMLPVIRKTKTGPSTDASVLEELAERGYTLPKHLLEYRLVEKLRSTYVDSLPKTVNPETGRIHTSYNQTVAATGRLASSDPNLQNIPIRSALGREIRKGFIPREGELFLGADYSQIELRILAHFSDDPAFIQAFREGLDIHRQTASIIFDVPIEAVTDEQRGRAKTINFATIYGQGEYSLAKQLQISFEEASNFIQEYFRRFAGVRAFLDAQVEMARARGYVETLSGRRRYIPELSSDNRNVRLFGERVAQNTPIQGTAADLIKIAMIRIHEGLKRGEAKGRILLQVHDELVFEVPEGEVDALQEFVIREMEGAMSLKVPLKVEVGRGKSWYDCKS